MIVKIGDIFETKCSTIVNTVNCVGVMGKGIALEFKKRYPEMFLDYVKRCNRNEVKTGTPYVYTNDDGFKILNFPTKDHWQSPRLLSGQFLRSSMELLPLSHFSPSRYSMKQRTQCSTSLWDHFSRQCQKMTLKEHLSHPRAALAL